MPSKPEKEDRVSLAPLGFRDAVKGLVKVDPEELEDTEDTEDNEAEEQRSDG